MAKENEASIRPAAVISMVVRSTLALITSDQSSKQDREKAKHFAVLLLCEFLKYGLPPPKDLAAFCASYIPSIIKSPKRGARPKHDSGLAFDLFRELTEVEGLSKSDALNKVAEFLDGQSDGNPLDHSTIRKSIEREQAFRDLLKKILNLE